MLHPGVVYRDFRKHQDDPVRIHGVEGAYFRDGKLASPEKISSGDDYVKFSKLVCWSLENSGKKFSGIPREVQILGR